MIVYDRRGRALTLRGPGRSGGEGTVYPIEGSPLWVAKIYHPQKLDHELHEKVAAMAATPPEDPAWEGRRHRSIAWVKEILYSDPAARAFAGFSMPAVDTRQFREAHLYYDPADRLAQFGGSFTWRHLMTAAANLASAVAAVHAAGHRVGDLRETNVLVSPTALITLIDCDSFEVRDHAVGRVFHTRVGTGEYLPRELQGADFRADIDRTLSDRFALAVLVFKLLMQGAHPFQARGRLVEDAPSPEAKIARGHFPYRKRARGVTPPEYAPSYDVLPPAVRALFERCFVDGHKRPARRPDPAQWFAALRAEAKSMRRCRTNENHWFGSHRRACPWCAMARDTGADPFPAPGLTGRQLALKPPPAAPPAQPAAVTPPREPGRVRGALRALGRVRVTRRRVAIVAPAVALVVAAFTPLGYSVERAPVRHLDWDARVRGTCPFDPARAGRPDPRCRSEWRLGPVELHEQHRRTFFLMRARTTRATVRYAVVYRSAGACSLPWIPTLEMNRRLPPVCLATCPERVELRARDGSAPAPLVAAGGVGARAGPLTCGTRYRGTWTFDTTEVAGAMSLHYPAFDDVPLPRALG